MQYCIDYFRKFKYLDEIDEITIKFRYTDTTLVDFMLAHKDKRINLYITDPDDFIEQDCIKIFQACREKYPELNFVFKINYFEKELLKLLVEEKFPFFFDEYIKDWDTLIGILKLHPTDVYIVESLGFEIISAASVIHEHNIRVRMFPNVAQSTWRNTTGLMKFFIRPEDVKIYEPYVDVLELFGDARHMSTYYKIYAKDKEWVGDLNEVIIDLDQELDNRCLLPDFAIRRLNCGKRCLKGRPCHICAATAVLADTLSKNDLTIRQLSAKQKSRVQKEESLN